MAKLLFSLLFLLATSWPVWGQTILIDPGHGGGDKGAEGWWGQGKNRVQVFEKDLALMLAKKIQAELVERGKSAFLTRSYDRFVSLPERAELANKLKADLFLSVHLNSDRSPQAQGLETYYLDNHQDKAVKKVEGVENRELAGEDKVVNQILIDLVIERTAPLSRKMAQMIHQQMKRQVMGVHRIKDRGVKPGLFYVLALAKRPAILLELGFISNQKDLALVQDPKVADQIAGAVASGLEQYFKTKK